MAIEQQGHGHTADVPDRALSYETMADDTAALPRQIGIRNADFLGTAWGAFRCRSREDTRISCTP